MTPPLAPVESDPGPLAVLAGGGVLPGLVAGAARSAGREVFIIGLATFADPGVIGGFPHVFIRLGAVGQMRAELSRLGARDVVLVGAVRRPSLLHLRPDAEGARLLARIGRAAFAGDDGLLAAVVRVMNEDGFRIVGAHEVLGGAIAPEGVLTRTRPDGEATSDVARGHAVARVLGAADVGQCCVVQQGLVLAVEAIEGTDAMIARASGLRREGLGGVLVKCVKPGQERRADLPTLGAATVHAAAAAGLRGIAFEAGSTLLIDRAAMIEAADAAGLFLLGLPASEDNFPKRIAKDPP